MVEHSERFRRDHGGATSSEVYSVLGVMQYGLCAHDFVDLWQLRTIPPSSIDHFISHSVLSKFQILFHLFFVSLFEKKGEIHAVHASHTQALRTFRGSIREALFDVMECL